MKCDIVGFTVYMIYDDGRVWSKRRKIFMKQNKDKDGYYTMGLWKHSKETKHKIHRLIGCHFIEHPGGGKNCIDHINRDRADNRLENLRWVTHRENMNNKSEYKKASNNTTGHQNIRKHKDGWEFQKKIHGKYYSKFFKTMEEAIAYKETFMKEHKSI